MKKNVNAYSCCILCLKSPNKVPDLKMHRFPENDKKRKIWLNACGLEADSYLSGRKLCSTHFDGTCYSKSGRRLKQDAIPTKYLKGHIIQPCFRLLKSDNETTNININCSSEFDQSAIHQSTSEETPKKEKRFICEIKTPDFGTLRRVRKSFTLAKTQIHMQKKIKLLNQKVRRLNKKLSTLKLLSSHSKQNNL